MAGRVPAKREQKKKPKANIAKHKLESLLDSPPQSVELIKPKRKERWETEKKEDESEE